MESLAIAYVLNCKQEKMRTLPIEMIREREELQGEITKLHELYEQALNEY